MSLFPGHNPHPVNLSVISGRGGLGDTIARLPAFRFVHDQYPYISMTVYIQDPWLDLVRFLLPEGPRLAYKALSQAPWTMNRPYIEFDQERLTSLALHLTQHAFLMLTDSLAPSLEAMWYPQAFPAWSPSDTRAVFDEIQNFVVFTTDYTAPARTWPAFHINELARRVSEAGYKCVLLGRSGDIPTGHEGNPVTAKANDGLKKELFVDLRNKTTLVEALGIMQRSRAVVGLDNGLLHLAHCTDVPVVMGFSTLRPEHRVPFRPKGTTKVIEAEVPCKGCQSRGLLINHDWRTCINTDHAYACLLTLSADRFWAELEPILVSK